MLAEMMAAIAVHVCRAAEMPPPAAAQPRPKANVAVTALEHVQSTIMLVESQHDEAAVLQLQAHHHLRALLLPAANLATAIEFCTALGLLLISMDEGASPPRATLAAGQPLPVFRHR